MLDVDEATFDRVYAVNVKSIYLTARHAVPELIKSGGNVVNIGSTAAGSPRPGLTWYNASKGWVITATRSMAVELAADNIRVNGISAGPIKTLAASGVGNFRKLMQHAAGGSPFKRNVTIEDVGNASAFICSDLAAGITGEIMHVDCGYSTVGMTFPVDEDEEVIASR